jgi:adenylate cyclase
MIAILLGLAVVAALTCLRWLDPYLILSMRENAFDQFQRISPRDHQAFPVRVADIDEVSLAAYGQWPWPRTRMAELVEKLHQLGASAIVFDILFSEPDRLSPAALMQDDTFRSVLLRSGSFAAGAQLPDSDKIFAQTIEGKPVVLGFAVTNSGSSEKPLVKAGFAFTGESPMSAPPRFEKTAPLLPDLQQVAAGIGNISFDPSSTSVIRRIPMLVTDGEQLYPSLSLEALRVAQGASTYLVANAPEVAASIGSIRVGDFSVETAASGTMWLHYAKDNKDRYVSAKRIIEESEAPATTNLINGNIVLVWSLYSRPGYRTNSRWHVFVAAGLGGWSGNCRRRCAGRRDRSAGGPDQSDHGAFCRYCCCGRRGGRCLGSFQIRALSPRPDFPGNQRIGCAFHHDCLQVSSDRP